MDAFQEALRGEQDKLALGIGSIINLLTIEDRLTAAAEREVAAWRSYGQALVEFRFATGSLVPVRDDLPTFDVRTFTTFPFAPAPGGSKCHEQANLSEGGPRAALVARRTGSGHHDLGRRRMGGAARVLLFCAGASVWAVTADLRRRRPGSGMVVSAGGVLNVVSRGAGVVRSVDASWASTSPRTRSSQRSLSQRSPNACEACGRS